MAVKRFHVVMDVEPFSMIVARRSKEMVE